MLIVKKKRIDIEILKCFFLPLNNKTIILIPYAKDQATKFEDKNLYVC